MKQILTTEECSFDEDNHVFVIVDGEDIYFLIEFPGDIEANSY